MAVKEGHGGVPSALGQILVTKSMYGGEGRGKGARDADRDHTPVGAIAVGDRGESLGEIVSRLQADRPAGPFLTTPKGRESSLRAATRAAGWSRWADTSAPTPPPAPFKTIVGPKESPDRWQEGMRRRRRVQRTGGRGIVNRLKLQTNIANPTTKTKNGGHIKNKMLTKLSRKISPSHTARYLRQSGSQAFQLSRPVG